MCYSVASLWVNAMRFASVTGDAKLEGSLVAEARQFLPGGKKGDKATKARHVDFNVFGAVPLEAAILTDRRDFLRMGMAYADDQWAPPRPDDLADFPKWLVSHYVPAARKAYLAVARSLDRYGNVPDAVPSGAQEPPRGDVGLQAGGSFGGTPHGEDRADECGAEV